MEDRVIAADLCERLYSALNLLDNAERRLIDEIYFSRGGKGKTDCEAAQTIGIPRMTLRNHEKKILAKIKKLMKL